MSAVTINSGEYADYTAGIDVAAGTVIVQGVLVGYLEQPLKANVKGALRVRGLVELPAETAAINAGVAVYWDAGNQRITTTAGGNTLCGKAEAAKALNATRIRVLLNG